jgi:hypothetical protein
LHFHCRLIAFTTILGYRSSLKVGLIEIQHGLYNHLTLGLGHVSWPIFMFEHHDLEGAGAMTQHTCTVCTVHVTMPIYFATVSFTSVTILEGRV